MTPSEASKLLAVAAAFDNRKPDADTARAWAAALDGIRPQDACDAIIAHYGRESTWIMPAAIRGEVKRIRSRRQDVTSIGEPPDGVADDPGRYLDWLRTARRAIGDGVSLHPEPPKAVLR